MIAIKKKYIGYRVKSFQEWLTQITFLIDTNEKKIMHILESLKELNVNFEFKKLQSGDYSYRVGDYFSSVVVERKNSLEEISGNFTEGRKQFTNEFERSKKKIDIVIEQGNFNDIMLQNYLTKFGADSFIGSFLAFEAKFNINTYFVSKKNITMFMLKLFYYKDYYVKAKIKETQQRADEKYYEIKSEVMK